MSYFTPPANFAYHSPYVIRCAVPVHTSEVAFLHEKMGVRKFYLINAPLTTVLRESGMARKLTYSQWNITSIHAGSAQLDSYERLLGEIVAERELGSNICLLGTPDDVALVCAGLRRLEGWSLAMSIRELCTIMDADVPSNDALCMLDEFDKHSS